MPARWRMVFLDAGGVLVHHPDARARLQSALRSLGLECPAEAIGAAVARALQVRDAGGPIDLAAPAAEEDARILAAAGAACAVLDLPVGMAWYLRDACYHLRVLELYPDVLPCLDALEQAGVAVGLISNAPHSLPSALHRLGVARRLSPLIVSAQVGCRKPGSEIYALALRQAGVRAHEAAFVDDREENVVAARLSGMAAWWLRREDGSGDGPSGGPGGPPGASAGAGAGADGTRQHPEGSLLALSDLPRALGLSHGCDASRGGVVQEG